MYFFVSLNELLKSWTDEDTKFSMQNTKKFLATLTSLVKFRLKILAVVVIWLF
jgi:hypothetical protein